MWLEMPGIEGRPHTVDLEWECDSGAQSGTSGSAAGVCRSEGDEEDIYVVGMQDGGRREEEREMRETDGQGSK